MTSGKRKRIHKHLTEQYYNDCKMFYYMGWRPEKEIPWHADHPEYYDINGQHCGFYPWTFQPHDNWSHLMIVAQKLGVMKLETDIKKAYAIILKEVEKKIGFSDVEESLFQSTKRRTYPN